MNEIIIYIKNNWFQLIVDFIAGMNVVVAGAKVMGWTKFAAECEKIEAAIIAMVGAALSRNKQSLKDGGIENEKNNSNGGVGSTGTDKPSTTGEPNQPPSA